MKQLFILLAFFAIAFTSAAQHDKKLYDTAANAAEDIANVVKQAAKETSMFW